VRKHPDEVAKELMANPEAKTAATVWLTDGWQAYERQLSEVVEPWVGKSGTQRLERTNGMIRQQNGRFHRRHTKFSNLWEPTEIVVRFAITDFNGIWQNSWTDDTAAQRAGLALEPWSWWTITTYPTLL
jgi:hypothetical protein